MGSKNILVWNVRGPNAGTHRATMCDLVCADCLSLVCLQETKMDVICDFGILQIIGLGFDYLYLLAIHTMGCILLAWKASVWSASSSSSWPFSVSTRLHHLSTGMDWWLASVYGPPREADKPAFITELQELMPLRSGPWLIMDDFNMIYHTEDKNNDCLNC
jgi:hypothetical protein